MCRFLPNCQCCPLRLDWIFGSRWHTRLTVMVGTSVSMASNTALCRGQKPSPARYLWIGSKLRAPKGRHFQQAPKLILEGVHPEPAQLNCACKWNPPVRLRRPGPAFHTSAAINTGAASIRRPPTPEPGCFPPHKRMYTPTPSDSSKVATGSSGSETLAAGQ